MAGKNLTIRDIAKLAGVSNASVSRALTGSCGISEKTRKHVLKICERERYTANSIARSLAVRKTRLLGCIVGSVDNPYMGQLACQIELYARHKGYNLILCNSTNKEEHEVQLMELLLGRQVDGIIITPTSRASYTALEHFLARIPVVVIGNTITNLRYNHVTVDNFKGTFLGAEYLVSLGHRSIAYVGYRSESYTHRLRAQGYQSVCETHGVKSLLIENKEAASSIERGYALAKELFSGPFPYTAIFAATDTTALGVMQAADEAGIAIPGDLSLIGFDNISYCALPRINLTTIEQPFSAIAASAVNMLIGTIESPQEGYAQMVLEPSLIKRGTCAAV
ncbi:LacI family transcriptional regulator [Spirochaetia bacterium]|nr:LacI family transcriptional regulator [Spirochaetia bacterium]